MSATADALMGIFGFKRVEGGMNKFTPGPWVVSNNSAFLIRAGDADTGRHIAQVGPANYHPSFAVDEPNAHLISAAPDLLEALENLHKEVLGRTGMYGDYYLSPVYNNALSAIAKARGEA